MKLSELTEIYRRGGRKELISAMEEFSQAEKAQMLEDIGLARRIGPGRAQEKTALQPLLRLPAGTITLSQCFR
ncbi:hypothetical protein [Rhizobium sp. BE258]|uniref:hypothetical protein n=1 Tax=Rhizobium sp. BE258 TaxID=2817722 RepID=UPI0028585754|nr:hypothetical protein [Rhizobium sp. BE258]MDR7145372.1 hypothetical protein [Rhizobium sp. BE258]